MKLVTVSQVVLTVLILLFGYLIAAEQVEEVPKRQKASKVWESAVCKCLTRNSGVSGTGQVSTPTRCDSPLQTARA